MRATKPDSNGAVISHPNSDSALLPFSERIARSRRNRGISLTHSTEMLNAVKMGAVQEVRELLQNGYPTKLDSNGRSLLHFACSHLQPAIVSFLLNHQSADPNGYTNEGKDFGHPLHLVVEAEGAVGRYAFGKRTSGDYQEENHIRDQIRIISFDLRAQACLHLLLSHGAFLENSQINKMVQGLKKRFWTEAAKRLESINRDNPRQFINFVPIVEMRGTVESPYSEDNVLLSEIELLGRICFANEIDGHILWRIDAPEQLRNPQLKRDLLQLLRRLCVTKVGPLLSLDVRFI